MNPKLSIKTPSRTIASLFSAKARKAVDKVIRDLPSTVRGIIEAEADRVLHTTSSVYKDGLQIKVNPGSLITKGSITVKMTKGLPAALEVGFDQFDIKAFMLAKAHKFSKKGVPYVDVPIGSLGKAAIGRAKQTIRRISPRSNPASWLHPGFRGVRAFENEKTRAEIQEQVKIMFKNAMGGK